MRECGPRDCRSPGHGRSLQHLDKTTLSAEDYVAQEAWRSATPPVCCRALAVTACGMTRHGTYGRKTPRGMRVARWYCRPCHRSFSALPGCLQARLAGTLASCEAQVVAAEEAGSLWACVRALYPEAIDLTSARRSLRRRVVGVHQSLRILVGLFPGAAGRDVSAPDRSAQPPAVRRGACVRAGAGLRPPCSSSPSRWIRRSPAGSPEHDGAVNTRRHYVRGSQPARVAASTDQHGKM